MAEKQQFNVYLPPDLVRRVKHAAVDADRSLSDFVESVLEHAFESESSSATDPGTEETPKRRPAPPHAGLSPMPIVYVSDMADALAFYKALGARAVHEGPSWSELRLGSSPVGLHAAAEPASGWVGLAMVTHDRLESLLSRLRMRGVAPARDITDESFGRSIVLRDPDGLLIQVNEHDPELYDAPEVVADGGVADGAPERTAT